MLISKPKVNMDFVNCQAPKGLLTDS